MNNLFLALALLALTGCAACQKYPTACAAITIVAAGCVKASLDSRHHDAPRAHEISIPMSPCYPQTNGSCR